MEQTQAGQCVAHLRGCLKINQILMAQRMQLSWRQYQRLESGAQRLQGRHVEALARVIRAEGLEVPRSLRPLEGCLLQLLQPSTEGEAWRSRFRLFRPRKVREEAARWVAAPGWAVSPDDVEGVIRAQARGRSRLLGPHGVSPEGAFWEVLGGPETVLLVAPGETCPFSHPGDERGARGGRLQVAIQASQGVRVHVPPGWRLMVGPPPPARPQVTLEDLLALGEVGPDGVLRVSL